MQYLGVHLLSSGPIQVSPEMLSLRVIPSLDPMARLPPMQAASALWTYVVSKIRHLLQYYQGPLRTIDRLQTAFDSVIRASMRRVLPIERIPSRSLRRWMLPSLMSVYQDFFVGELICSGDCNSRRQEDRRNIVRRRFHMEIWRPTRNRCVRDPITIESAGQPVRPSKSLWRMDHDHTEDIMAVVAAWTDTTQCRWAASYYNEAGDLIARQSGRVPAIDWAPCVTNSLQLTVALLFAVANAIACTSSNCRLHLVLTKRLPKEVRLVLDEVLGGHREYEVSRKMRRTHGWPLLLGIGTMCALRTGAVTLNDRICVEPVTMQAAKCALTYQSVVYTVSGKEYLRQHGRVVQSDLFTYSRSQERERAIRILSNRSGFSIHDVRRMKKAVRSHAAQVALYIW